VPGALVVADVVVVPVIVVFVVEVTGVTVVVVALLDKVVTSLGVNVTVFATTVMDPTIHGCGEQ
jgi:hypothetical protein